MKEIDRLYEQLFHPVEGGFPRMDGKVRAEIFRRITEELESLHEVQGTQPDWTAKFRKTEQQIRRRLLKEIQIIIDEYTLAEQAGQIPRWEERYGDIEHYKEEFYRIRRGSGSVKNNRSPRSKFVKGAWEKVEFMKIEDAPKDPCTGRHFGMGQSEGPAQPARARGAGASEDAPKGHRTGPRIK